LRLPLYPQSCVMRRLPSIAPALPDDIDIYMVLDYFGSLLGRAWPAADEQRTDRERVIKDLLEGQYSDPVRIVAFNTAEGWSRDVSEEIADELTRISHAVVARLGRLGDGLCGTWRLVAPGAQAELGCFRAAGEQRRVVLGGRRMVQQKLGALRRRVSDGRAAGAGKRRVMQPDPAHGAEQDVGERCQPQTQLVGAHGGGRGTIGIEIELAFLDPVLHVAAGAVELLVEVFGLALSALERGDDEARIGPILGDLGLADDPALAAPAAARPIPELPEVLRGLVRPPAFRLCPFKLACDRGNQAVILLQAEQEVDAVRLAPGHQLLPRK